MDIYSEEEAQENFCRMLQQLSGVMSDRASVMKSFNKALDEERKMLLQSEEGLQFLHCNAHFLLGLSTESEKILAQNEKDSGERLGRDRLPKFHSFLDSQLVQGHSLQGVQLLHVQILLRIHMQVSFCMNLLLVV